MSLRERIRQEFRHRVQYSDRDLERTVLVGFPPLLYDILTWKMSSMNRANMVPGRGGAGAAGSRGTFEGPSSSGELMPVAPLEETLTFGLSDAGVTRFSATSFFVACRNGKKQYNDPLPFTTYLVELVLRCRGRFGRHRRKSDQVNQLAEPHPAKTTPVTVPLSLHNE